MTDETTPPTPDEVDAFLAGVENWHDSMPFHVDALEELLKEFRRLRSALPRLREVKDRKLVELMAERDEALRSADQNDRMARTLIVSNNELKAQQSALKRDLENAQAGAQFAMTAGISYSQEVDRLNETVKGLRERNEILAAAHERDTEALGTIRKVVFEETALHHEQRMGRIAAALVKAEEGL